MKVLEVKEFLEKSTGSLGLKRGFGLEIQM
jgi:hypothetical protein